MARPMSLQSHSQNVGRGARAPLPDGVWADRMQRCRAAMRARGIDVLLVYSAGNGVGGYEWVRYLANYIDAAPFWASETWMAIPLDEDPTLFVAWPQMVEQAASYSPVKDIRLMDVWRDPAGGDRHGLVAPILADYLKEKGLHTARIGFGHGGRGGRWAGFTPGAVIGAVQQACAQGTMIDAARLLWDITQVKNDYEIAQLRQVAEMNCHALGAALGALRPGSSEYELYTSKVSHAVELGAEIADPEHAQLAVIHPVGLRPFYVTNYQFQHGDMFIADSGLAYGGFESDIARNAIIGTPTDRQRRTYETCMEIAHHIEDALRPGVVARELWEIKEREAKRAGYDMTMPMAGHGVGVAKHEPPDLMPWDETVIRENMVINIEVGLFAPPDACFCYEDTYVVRANGPELLTPLSSELFVA